MGKDSVEERERRPRRERRGKSSNTADWQRADPEILRAAIVASALTGGALRFGYSRDGGAFAIGVYGDGEPYTDFVGGAEEIDGYLQDYIQLFEDIRNDPVLAGKGVNPFDKAPKK